MLGPLLVWTYVHYCYVLPQFLGLNFKVVLSWFLIKGWVEGLGLGLGLGPTDVL